MDKKKDDPCGIQESSSPITILKIFYFILLKGVQFKRMLFFDSSDDDEIPAGACAELDSVRE